MIGVPAVNVYVITSTDDKRKTSSVLSLVWSTYSLGYVFAPALGSFIATIMGMQFVLQLAFVGSIAPESKRGTWLCIPQSMSLLAGFAAPLIGGLLYRSSVYYPFAISLVAMPILALFAFSNLTDSTCH